MSQSNPEFEPAKPRRRSFVQNIVLAIFCLLVAGPIATYGCRGERAKWTAASAMNLYERGDRDAALKQLEAAVVDSNYDPNLGARLANLLAENGNAKHGLEICDKVLEMHRDPNLTINTVLSQSTCEQYLDRPEQALETLKSVYDLVGPSAQIDDHRLNNLAYYRALANVELQQAQVEIRQAIANLNNQATWPTGFDLTLSARTLMAIGLISRQLDHQRDALKLLDGEIANLTELESSEDHSLSETIYQAIQDTFPVKLKSEEEQITVTERLPLNRSRDCLAFLLVTRALIQQDLGNDRQCDLDRARIVKLGYQPDDLLEQLPSLLQCLAAFDQAATYLDTHGFVLLQEGAYVSARENLDLAIAAAEFNLLALDSPLHNSNEEVPFDLEQRKREYGRIAAVLHYHRYQLFKRAGLADGQDDGFEVPDDAERIRELGFDPSSRLF